MEVCESGHDPIAYNAKDCPLCDAMQAEKEARDDASNLSCRVMELEDERDELQSEVRALETRLDNTKDALRESTLECERLYDKIAELEEAVRNWEAYNEQ